MCQKLGFFFSPLIGLIACLFETEFCYIAQAGQELAKELRLLPSSLDPFVPVSRFCND